MYVAKKISKIITEARSLTEILESCDWDEDAMNILLDEISAFVESFEGTKRDMLMGVKKKVKQLNYSERVGALLCKVISSEISLQDEMGRYEA